MKNGSTRTMRGATPRFISAKIVLFCSSFRQLSLGVLFFWEKTYLTINVSNAICFFGGAFVTKYSTQRRVRDCFVDVHQHRLLSAPEVRCGAHAAFQASTCLNCLFWVAGREKKAWERKRQILSGTRMNTPIFVLNEVLPFRVCQVTWAGVDRVSSLSWLLLLALFPLSRANNKGLSLVCIQKERGK